MKLKAPWEKHLDFGSRSVMPLIVEEFCGGFFPRADSRGSELILSQQPLFEAMTYANTDGKLGRWDICQCKIREDIYQEWKCGPRDRHQDLVIVGLPDETCQRLDKVLEKTEHMVRAQYGKNLRTIFITERRIVDLGKQIGIAAECLIKEWSPDVSSSSFDIVDASVIAQYCLRKYEEEHKPSKQVDFKVNSKGGIVRTVRLPILAAYAYIQALRSYGTTERMKITPSLQKALDTEILKVMYGLFFVAANMGPLVRFDHYPPGKLFVNRYGSYHIFEDFLENIGNLFVEINTSSMIALMGSFSKQAVEIHEWDIMRRLIKVMSTQATK